MQKNIVGHARCNLPTKIIRDLLFPVYGVSAGIVYKARILFN